MRIQYILLALIFTTAYAEFSADSAVIPLHTVDKLKEAKEPEDFSVCIFYHSSEGCDKCSQAATIFEEFTENIKDIVLSYSIDCADVDEPKEIFLCKSKNRKQLPQIACYAPPTMKINPYTHKPMVATENFYQGRMDSDSITDFAIKYMPVHRKQVSSKKELKAFMRSKRIPTKIVLFTSRQETSSMFKGLTSIFRDRVDFAEVKDVSKDILEQEGVEVEELPLLIMYKREGKGQVSKKKFSKDINLDSVREWISPHALQEKAPEEKDNSEIDESDSTEQSKIPYLTTRVYEKMVLSEEKFVLIHIYRDGEEAGSWDEIQKRFGTMMEYFNMRISNSLTEEFAKETLKATKIPSIKLLPIGTNKKATSKIFFSPEIDVKEMVKDVIELIDDDTVALNEKTFQTHISGAFQENKKPLIYFYKSGKGVAPAYKYLSHLSKFKELFKFYSMVDPREEILQGFGLQGKPLPKLVMLFKPEESEQKKKPKDDKDPGIQLAVYQGKYNYNDLSKFFSQFLEKAETNSKKVKVLKEIEAHEDFEKVCNSRKSFCFIGFLSAENRKNKDFEKKLEILMDLNDQYSTDIVSFSWIDATCHRYLMERVNLQEEILPQIVVYYPSTNSFTNQIGTYSKESLEAFIQRALGGRVPRQKISEDIDIDEKNCSAVYEELKKKRSAKSPEDAKIEEEILREMEAERKAREKKEKEEARKAKKEAKKAKKKGKKKKEL